MYICRKVCSINISINIIIIKERYIYINIIGEVYESLSKTIERHTYKFESINWSKYALEAVTS